MLDVLTIGHVYLDRHVYCYLSGLGRPLSVEKDYFDSDQCWFNCAWTLQEVGIRRTVCGDTPNGPLHAKPDKDGNYETEILTKFYKQLQSLNSITIGLQLEEINIFKVLAEMQCRMSTNPVDKVAGLGFCLCALKIPAYYERKSLENAWTALVSTLLGRTWGDLFFLYPEPGNAGSKWRPSWDQIMTKSLLPVSGFSKSNVFWDIMDHGYRCEIICIDSGYVQGLTVAGMPGVDRHGKLVVDDSRGIAHTFEIVASHQYSIPERLYTLAGDSESLLWVIGKKWSKEHFEKLSVFKIVDNKQRDRLEKLGVGKKCWNLLL